MSQKRDDHARLIGQVDETIRVSKELARVSQQFIEGNRELAGAANERASSPPGSDPSSDLVPRLEVSRAAARLLAADRVEVSAREFSFRELLFLAGAAALGDGTLGVEVAHCLPIEERASLAAIGDPWVVLIG